MNNIVPVELPEFYPVMVKAFEDALLIENATERMEEIMHLQNRYQKLDWITPLLETELETLFPKRADIDTENNNQKDLSKFKENMQKICVPGRWFASNAQFQQAMKLLCGKWSTVVVARNTTICCHYKASDNRRLHPDPAKRRRAQQLPTFDCPFALRYSIPGFPKTQQHPDWKPRILWQVTSFINILFISTYYQLLYSIISFLFLFLVVLIR